MIVDILLLIGLSIIIDYVINFIINIKVVWKEEEYERKREGKEREVI